MLMTERRNAAVDTAASKHSSVSFKDERDIYQSRILIVDDESLNIELVRRFLELGGYRTLIADDIEGNREFLSLVLTQANADLIRGSSSAAKSAASDTQQWFSRIPTRVTYERF